MQTTASIHRVATIALRVRQSAIGQVWGHKRARSPLRLPWLFNLVAAGSIAAVIGMAILLRL